MLGRMIQVVSRDVREAVALVVDQVVAGDEVGGTRRSAAGHCGVGW